MAEARDGGTQVQPWERLKDESPVAHEAFLDYCDAGSRRRYAQTARRLRKSYSLIRRWAVRHAWPERVWAWDVAQRRDVESALKEQREQAIRRQLTDADRLQRLAMAKLTGLVHRDPVTGEASLDPKVSVRDAVVIYRLGWDIIHTLSGVDGDGARPPGADPLPAMTDPELAELIGLARDRARAQKGDEADDENSEANDETATDEHS